MLRDEDQDRRRIAELELQQAQYEASLAERLNRHRRNGAQYLGRDVAMPLATPTIA